MMRGLVPPTATFNAALARTAATASASTTFLVNRVLPPVAADHGRS
jgi:hypothetical protein